MKYIVCYYSRAYGGWMADYVYSDVGEAARRSVQTWRDGTTLYALIVPTKRL